MPLELDACDKKIVYEIGDFFFFLNSQNKEILKR